MVTLFIRISIFQQPFYMKLDFFFNLTEKIIDTIVINGTEKVFDTIVINGTMVSMIPSLSMVHDIKRLSAVVSLKLHELKNFNTRKLSLFFRHFEFCVIYLQNYKKSRERIMKQTEFFSVHNRNLGKLIRI